MMEKCRLDFLQITASPAGSPMDSLVSSLSAIASRPRPAGTFVGGAFDRVLEEARRKGRWAREGMEAAVTGLLVAVLRAYERGDATGGAFSEPVARVLRHMERSPRDWPTVHELARLAGLGATQLQLRFRRETGLTLNAHAMERRLARAKVLMAQGRGCAETAEALGFSSSQYFATAFKRHVGIAPGAFARNARKF